MAKQLARPRPSGAHAVAPVAEQVDRMLAETPGSRIDRLSTPLTSENRHAGRSHRPRPPVKPSKIQPPGHCLRCGGEVPPHKRLYCDPCLLLVHAEQHGGFTDGDLAVLDTA
ncbi:MAG TPA: hypothetical protein VFA66_03835 [Gaiellaceae bacterium]|nr:hypothetical protein [Gaiellaceae bacterium]